MDRILNRTLNRLSSKKDHDNRELIISLRKKMKYIALGFACTLLFAVFYQKNVRSIMNDNSQSSGGNGMYKGEPYMSERTLSKKVLAETPFARCEYHSVAQDENLGSSSESSVIEDWLFIEEIDAINVIVMDQEQKFVVLKQKKYAIPGETYSVIGGFMDEGETPYDAAKREVREEVGLGSNKTMEELLALDEQDIDLDEKEQEQDQDGEQEQEQEEKTEKQNERKLQLTEAGGKAISKWNAEIGRISDNDPDWVYLGKYRTSANRGGGYLYSYLLKNAVPLAPNGGTADFKSEGDNESQEILHLTEADIIEAISTNRFKEVKWIASLSLALMAMREEEDSED